MLSKVAMAVTAPTSATAATGDEIIFDMLSLIHVRRNGSIERFEPYEFVPPSFDHTTGVQSKDVTINPSTGVMARLYLPPSSTDTDLKIPVLVFYHGGGFCVHRAASAHYHNYLNHLTAKSRVLTVSIDYRLAPEHPLPAAYEDSWQALRWVVEGPEPWISKFGNLDKVILAGDSAGANIVHDLGMRLGREGMEVDGMVLLNPYFWGEERIGREAVKREGVIINLECIDRLWPFVCPGTVGNDDSRMNPWAAGAVSLAGLGCRRVLVSCGNMDLLFDRARMYCDKLKESGWIGVVELVVADGEDHSFFLPYPGSVGAETFMARFVDFCNVGI